MDNETVNNKKTPLIIVSVFIISILIFIGIKTGLIIGFNDNSQTDKINIAEGSYTVIKSIKDAKLETSDNDIISIENDKIIAKKQGKATVKVVKDNKTVAEYEIIVSSDTNDITNNNDNTQTPKDETPNNTPNTTNNNVAEDNTVVPQKDNTTPKPQEETPKDETTTTPKENTTTTPTIDTPKNDNTQTTQTPQTIAVSSIELTNKKEELTVGETLQLGYKINPDNATDKTVTWTSSNTNIATVDNKGKVTSISEGTVTISVKTSNWKTATVAITVKHSPTSYCEYLIKTGVKELDYKTFIDKFPNNDDYYAIKSTHECANKHNLPVNITKGNYNIYKKEKGSIIVQTNTNFNNSTVYIHDESGIIGNSNGVDNEHVYVINDTPKCVTKSNVKINNMAYFNVVPEFAGSDNSFVKVTDSSHKTFIPVNKGPESGQDASDVFRVDSTGKILDDVFFTYNGPITYKKCEIPTKQLEFYNAIFITVVNPSKSYLNINHASGSIYARRGISVRRSNVLIDKIRHYYKNSKNEDVNLNTYQYYGFFDFTEVANITFSNSRVYALKVDSASNNTSTYDMVMTNVSNMKLYKILMADYTDSTYYDKTNQLNSDRWGVMGSSGCKRFTIDNCILNRIDAHRGMHRLTVTNTTLGQYGLMLTGSGPLSIDNVIVRYTNNFLTLREGEGSFWKGSVSITNSKIHPKNTNAVNLVWFKISKDNNGATHNFGFDLSIPNINLSNFRVMNTSNKLNIYNRSRSYITENTKNVSGFSVNYNPTIKVGSGVTNTSNNLSIKNYAE